MESLVYFIISHSQMVLITLVGSIILCVFGLLLISFHSPQDAVANEVGNVDRIEGVLRQILSEQDWPAKATGGAAAPTVSDLLPADPVILGDPLAAAAPAGAAAPSPAAVTPANTDTVTIPVAPTAEPVAAEAAAPAAPAVDVSPLKNKIKELEEKLAEYSVIEEDIADLSRFRQENDDLKKKLTHVTGVSADEAARMPWDDFEKVVKDKNLAPAKETVATTIDKPE
jgi:hypothetical protein